MKIYTLCALGLVLFSRATSTPNRCGGPSVDSPVEHCIEVEDSTVILKEEGVTFIDQLTDHSLSEDHHEIDNQEELNESVSKWYPESLSFEETPLEVNTETTTNSLWRKDFIDVRNLSGGEVSNHRKEESVLVKRTYDNELHAEDLNVLTVREKKDVSSPARSLRVEKRESSPPGSSVSSTVERLPDQTSYLDAAIRRTPVKLNSSQGSRQRKSELPDSIEKPLQDESKSIQTLKKESHVNMSEQFSNTEIISRSVNDVSKVEKKLASREENYEAEHSEIQKEDKSHLLDERKQFPASETEVSIERDTFEDKSVGKSKLPETSKLNHEDITTPETKYEENIKEFSFQEELMCTDTGEKNYDSSPDISTANSPASSTPKFDKQSMTLDLFRSVSLEKEFGGGEEIGGGKGSAREVSEKSAGSSEEGAVETSSQGVAASLSREDTRGAEFPAEAGEDLSVAMDRLMATDEDEESAWSRMTREEHDEVLSRFLPARTLPNMPAAAAQFQRRPSRLSTAPTELTFPAVPQGDAFHIQELGLSDGVFLFSYLAGFLSLLQPAQFPIELIRDALWNRVSIVSLITQSLQVEAGFIACLAVGVFIAVSLPCYVAVHACCTRSRRGRQQAGAGDWDDGAATTSDCRRRALLFVLHVLVLFIGLGVGGMFATNEQMAGAVRRTPRVLHTALADATTFLRNSNLQLRSVVTESLDRALTAASDDLDNVELLLGEPIQNELAVETGVDVALDTLVEVGSAAAAISGKVGFLLAYGAETRDLVAEARERLQDLRQQVESFRRQCPARDRPLCDTVDPTGLDAAMRLDQLLYDKRLEEMHDLREANLSSLAYQVKAEFQKVPQLVEEQTREARTAVRRQLARQRGQVDDEAWALGAVTRDLSARVEDTRDKALLLVRGLADIEYWRWFTGLGASIAVLVMWVLMLAGLMCGCCGAQQKAAPTLLASVVVASLLSLALWLLALGSLVVGGHGEVFVCRPLYDEPQFPDLTSLLDRPGVLFRRGGGFLSNMLYGNDTLDVPLKEVLMKCQDNGATYAAFKLRSVYDVNAASDHRTWDSLHDDLSRLQVNLTGLRLLTPDLQRQLTSLVDSVAVNLTAHRMQLSRQVTGKDLSSFADQLESVANQIKDLATASRMETLASRTRRMLISHIQPLEQRKEDLVYQLTALEVQMQPLQRQVNQSLSHLKTIQYFINNQGDSISKQKAKDYVRRLLSYVDQYRDHVMQSTSAYVAPCKPVWDIYHAVRQLLCRHILDPLNGFWFSCVWCLLMFLVSTPLCLKLAEVCKEGGGGGGGLLQHGNSDSPSQALMMPESNTWSSNNRVGESDGW